MPGAISAYYHEAMQTGHSADFQVEARNLVIGYPDRVICGPLDLHLVPGAGLGVIGANGSGKSTLIRTILGHLSSVEGSVEFQGLPVSESSAHFRRTVAVQISDGAFFEELSVAEHLEMVARGHGIGRWKQAVAAELEFFEIAAVAEHLPGELSSGQRRKLLLAATLIRPAELMILDEPEQRLDLKIRHKLYRRLAAVRASGTALLAVTHDPLMLRSCLDQALLLDEDTGRLLDAQAGAQWLER